MLLQVFGSSVVQTWNSGGGCEIRRIVMQERRAVGELVGREGRNISSALNWDQINGIIMPTLIHSSEVWKWKVT